MRAFLAVLLAFIARLARALHGRARKRARPPPDCRARGRRARSLGRRGERAAKSALEALGWRVLARDVRTPGGEVDLVVLDGETVVLVEVKAGAGPPGRPLGDRVDHEKRERLRAAWAFLARGRGWAGRPHRFDVVEVSLGGRRPVCTLHRGAFHG